MRTVFFIFPALLFGICSVLYYSSTGWSVTSGNFRGISIGYTKELTLEALLLKKNVTAVSGYVVDPPLISKFTMKNLDALESIEIIYVRNKNDLVQLDFEGDHLNRVEQIGLLPVDLGVNVGQTWPVVRQSIKEYLVKWPGSTFKFRNYGFGKDRLRTELLLSEGRPIDLDGKSWLFKQDSWLFHENDSLRYAVLNFENGVLTEIKYWHPLFEMP
jgi:hypothetical protein